MLGEVKMAVNDLCIKSYDPHCFPVIVCVSEAHIETWKCQGAKSASGRYAVQADIQMTMMGQLPCRNPSLVYHVKRKSRRSSRPI